MALLRCIGSPCTLVAFRGADRVHDGTQITPRRSFNTLRTLSTHRVPVVTRALPLVQIEYTTPIGGVSGGGSDAARQPSLNECPTAALDALASSAQRVRADCGPVLAQML